MAVTMAGLAGLAGPLTAAFALAVAAATLPTATPKSDLSMRRSSDSNSSFRFDVDRRLNNPYPDRCRERSKMSSAQIRALNACILKQKWTKEILLPLERTYARRVAGSVSDQVPIRWVSSRAETAPDPSKPDGGSEDCLYGTRGLVRPFPGVCRTKRYAKQFSKEAWDALWKEIQGDFSYMYDYVLWDETFTERKENQLWYLILYLKVVATMVESPTDIYDHVMNKPRNVTLSDRVDALQKQVEDMATDMMDALELEHLFGASDDTPEEKHEVSLVVTKEKTFGGHGNDDDGLHGKNMVNRTNPIDELYPGLAG